MEDEQPQQHKTSIYTDTVGISVDGVQSGSSGIQLCPALLVPSPQLIPQAARHIYSRLAAAASHIDEGIPDLLISLVSTGNNFSFEVIKTHSRTNANMF